MVLDVQYLNIISTEFNEIVWWYVYVFMSFWWMMMLVKYGEDE